MKKNNNDFDDLEGDDLLDALLGIDDDATTTTDI